MNQTPLKDKTHAKQNKLMILKAFFIVSIYSVLPSFPLCS